MAFLLSEDDKYVGTWKIVECVSLAGTVDTSGIEGSEFSLSETGDVSWRISDGSEAMPFFNSDTFEVVNRHKLSYLKFFGTMADHIVEFKVEVSEDLMLLTCERCCLLQCQKVVVDSYKGANPYNLQLALEEGYFSDISLRAENGTEFKLHSIILQIAVPELDWCSIVPPMNGLPEDVLRTITYFLYNECLPRGLTVKQAKQCIHCMSKTPAMTKFVQLCQMFLKNTALKQQIISLVEDMHSCAERIIDMFTVKKSYVGVVTPESYLAANPPKLCYVIKQAAREGAIACAKLGILCNLFASRSRDLSQEERHEIIKYTRSRLPVFLKQLHEFSEAFQYQLSFMGNDQRHEIATYLLPEVDSVMATITSVAEEFQAALDPALKDNAYKTYAQEKADKKDKKEPVKDMLGKTLRNAIHIRELKLLKSMHDFVTSKCEQFEHKKQFFSEKSDAEKIQIIKHLMVSLKNREVPLFLDRIEELMAVMEEKFKWREWKYLFKLGSSKMAWGVNKLLNYQATLHQTIKRVIDLVAKEQFTASIVSLGLWSTEQTSDKSDLTSTSCAAHQSVKPTTAPPVSKPMQYLQLNMVESLCVSPTAQNSTLATGVLELFRKKEKADMIFEIVQVHDIGDTVIDHTYGEPIERHEPDRDVEINEIPAHCVILASRCNWFSRALQSGMRESIDKKISIHDTNPDVFRLFLEFVYGGHLCTETLTTDQLTELLTLADRYEVSGLQELCEYSLRKHVDVETAVYLFGLADQLQSRSLKERVLSYMVENQDVLDEDTFIQLPPHLKLEVKEAFTVEGDQASSNFNRSDSQSSSSLDDMIHHVSLNARRYSSSSSSSDIAMTTDQLRLNDCVASLREVIGDDVPHSDLVQFVLAADYDVSRAVNFYFQSS